MIHKIFSFRRSLGVILLPNRPILNQFFLCIILVIVGNVSSTFSSDQPFYNAKDWESGKAEILEYEVKKTYLSKEMVFPAFIITEGKYYSIAESKSTRKSQKRYVPIINSSISYSFTRDKYPRHSLATLKVLRNQKMPFIRQDVSILSWNGSINRECSATGSAPSLRINSWNEGQKTVTFEKQPVYTTEQLFLYVRSLPLTSGHQENIWLLGSLMEDITDTKVYYAEVKISKDKQIIKDQETRHIVVTREDEKKLEFWLLENGLHQVALAILSDGTTYTLKNIQWQRYWDF